MELLSLHIPKTAGTSFRHILKNVYGEDQVVRFDINEIGEVRLNEVLYHKNVLPEVKVIHGHFVLERMRLKFNIPSDCKIITWVRDPVQRVISNFFYLESRLRDMLSYESKNLKILIRMQRTLIEFSRDEINRNRQTKFLKGAKPEAYDFIGVQEFFNEDIISLASVLNWKNVPEIIHHNKTPEISSGIPKEILDEIRELNMQDVLLYDEVLKLRKSRSGQIRQE